MMVFTNFTVNEMTSTGDFHTGIYKRRYFENNQFDQEAQNFDIRSVSYCFRYQRYESIENRKN